MKKIKTVIVRDKMQKHYRYTLVEAKPEGVFYRPDRFFDFDNLCTCA